MLRRTILYTALCLLVGLFSPSEARNYLVFQKGQTISNEVWQDVEPQPGINVPDDCIVKPWITQNNDNDPSHYILTLAGVRRDNTLDEKPEAPPLPDTDGFFTEVLQSGAFDDSDMLKMLIVEREWDVDKRNLLILQLLQGREPELIAKLMEIAAKHNIQLPIPQ